MDRATFNSLVNEEVDKIFELNHTKGTEYAGDDNALANFYHHASQLGLRPEQIWAVYAGKHWDAIMSYCKKGEVLSEPIEGRVRDMILYLFLMLGLVAEKNAGTT